MKKEKFGQVKRYLLLALAVVILTLVWFPLRQSFNDALTWMFG